MAIIGGILSREKRPVDEAKLAQLLQVPIHAGIKYHTGHWYGQTIALAGAIPSASSDLQEERLPYYDSPADLAITADVRLDNRQELCSSLAIDPGQRNSISDSQLILRAYQKWGVDCPIHLVGDFAFAIWNGRAGHLFCARDILGVRQFYYHLHNDHFLFSSDIGALLNAGVADTLDLAYLSAHFRYGQNYPHDTHTYYAEMRKLARAQAMIVDSEKMRSWIWWDPGELKNIRYQNEDAYVDQMRFLFDSAVHDRLRGSQPVGAHLSGGLDCTSVSVMANRQLKSDGRPFSAFSWSPPPDSGQLEADDERLLTDRVSELEGIPLYYTAATAKDHASLRLHELGRYKDDFFAHELPIRRAAMGQNIHTMLSGWGGDEMVTFNGRGYFAEMLRRRKWRTFHRELSIGATSRIKIPYRKYLYRGIYPYLPDAIYTRLNPPNFGFMSGGSPLPTIFQEDFAAQFLAAVPLPAKSPLREGRSVRETQLVLLANGHITQRIEGWAAAGSRAGITYAYPFLDRRLIEFALGIPAEMSIKNGRKRYLFRQAVRDILPDERWNNNKSEPALNADRKRLGKGSRKFILSTLQDVFSDNHTYHILDGDQARAAVEEQLKAADEKFLTWDITASLVVELLLNHDLGQAVQDRIWEKV